jgi:hypothetical protein
MTREVDGRTLTLDQLDGDLAGLSYKAGAPGTDSVAVDVWNQAGVEDSNSFAVTIKGGSSQLLSPVMIVPNNGGQVVFQGNTAISSTSGDQMRFIGKISDTAVTSGETLSSQSVQVYDGISAPVGNDNAGFDDLSDMLGARSAPNWISPAADILLNGRHSTPDGSLLVSMSASAADRSSGGGLLKHLTTEIPSMPWAQPPGSELW